jgi:hypothetical protein
MLHLQGPAVDMDRVHPRSRLYAHDPHVLVREELDALGPAALCPACAGTPDPAGNQQALPARQYLRRSLNSAQAIYLTCYDC